MRRGPKLVATIAAIGGTLAMGACAVTPPQGPTVMALPPPGKSLAAFQQDDYACRNYASYTIGPVAPGQGTNQVVTGAGLGTLLGAAAGAAIGAAAGNAGAGAAIGAGTGLAGGTLVGANNAGAGQYDLQTRYNIAYIQCMYSHGNSVQSPPPPGWGGVYGAGYGPGWGGGWWGDPWFAPGFYSGGLFVVGGGGCCWNRWHGGWGGWHGGWGGWHGGWHGGGWHSARR